MTKEYKYRFSLHWVKLNFQSELSLVHFLTPKLTVQSLIVMLRVDARSGAFYYYNYYYACYYYPCCCCYYYC